MTQDEIIRMARDAGFVEDTNYEIYGSYYHLERFAALVAAHEREKQAEQEQEPVAWMEDSIEFYASDRPSSTFTIPLYAAPVQQVDLTPQEVTALIMEGAAGGGWQGFAEQVQTAYKEKNK